MNMNPESSKQPITGYSTKAARARSTIRHIVATFWSDYVESVRTESVWKELQQSFFKQINEYIVNDNSKLTYDKKLDNYSPLVEWITEYWNTLWFDGMIIINNKLINYLWELEYKDIGDKQVKAANTLKEYIISSKENTIFDENYKQKLYEFLMIL
jgi:hypothetical protein